MLSIPMRPCAWCAAEFPVIRKPGRARIYCNHTCRQRAYEHRHGFRHERTVRPLPGQAPGEAALGTGYERGGWGIGGKRVHAMRTSVRPQGRLRETLCGHLIVPKTGFWFMSGHPQACKVCVRAALAAPLRHPISASNELARLRAIIDEVVEERVEPGMAIAWMANDAPTQPPPSTLEPAEAA